MELLVTRPMVRCWCCWREVPIFDDEGPVMVCPHDGMDLYLERGGAA